MSLKIIIRKTKEEDFEVIARLLVEARLKDTYFTEKKFRKMLERNRDFCYVAERKGKIVGTAFGSHDGAFRGYIQKVAVSQEVRRQKIASSLVKKIVSTFEEANIPLMYAHVEKNNLPSVKLLESLRFQIRDSHYLIDKGYKPRE